MGFSRDEVYICNVVKCRPPGNRNPEPDEIAACEPFLRAQLAAHPAQGDRGAGQVRGADAAARRHAHHPAARQWREYQGVQLMPTFHPAYLLRSPEEKKQAWEDLQAGDEALRKQAGYRRAARRGARMKGVLETRDLQAPALEGNPLGDPARRHAAGVPAARATARARSATRPSTSSTPSPAAGPRWTERLGVRPQRAGAAGRADRRRGRFRPSSACSRTGGRRSAAASGSTATAIGRYRDYVAKDVVRLRGPHVPHAAQGGGARGGGAQLGRLRRAGDGALPPGASSPTSAATRGTRASSTATCRTCPRRPAPLLKAGGVEAWYQEFRQRARETKMRGEDFTGDQHAGDGGGLLAEEGRAAGHRAALRSQHRRG